MTDFLFHKVTEKEKESIKEEAKQIMENFSKKLSKIDKEISESLIERDKCERDEKGGEECDNSFRKIIFDNAPEKDGDFIIAERKKW